MEIQVDIEAKPSHYQLVSGSSTEDSLHVHAQMAENEEEGSGRGGSGSNEEDPSCKHQTCDQRIFEIKYISPRLPKKGFQKMQLQVCFSEQEHSFHFILWLLHLLASR